MKIAGFDAVPALGAYWWKDEAAIKHGAGVPDGFSFRGTPETPGFESIMQPSEAVSLLLVLEDGQVAYGDGCAVANAARSGRDPLFRAAHYAEFARAHLTERIVGVSLDSSFRELAAEWDAWTADGKRLHSGLRYGLSQALLDAIARTRRQTMTEVIVDEYGLPFPRHMPRFFGQSGSTDWTGAVEKMILRRIPVLPQAAIHTVTRFHDLLEHVKWFNQRRVELAGPDYVPDLHYDTHGNMAIAFADDEAAMLEYFRQLKDAAGPCPLFVEDPVVRESRAEQLASMKRLRERLREEQIDVGLVADEWCNTLEDITDCVDLGAADMIQIKSPDLGGINNLIEAVLLCNARGVGSYLGGSCAESDRAAQVCAHVGLATQARQMLAKPGLGVDEGVSIMHNEMQRALYLARARQQAGTATA
jgi:methylaspartate ammonia-lyase